MPNSQQDTLSQAAAALKEIRPAYNQIVDYFQQVFIIQERALAELEYESATIVIPRDKIVRRDGFPLLDITQWPIDIAATQKVMAGICDLTAAAGLKTAGSARITAGMLNPAALRDQSRNTAKPGQRAELPEITADLVAAYLRQDDQFFTERGSQWTVDPEFLEFAVYQGMVPSIRHCSRRLARHLEKENGAVRDTCPVCGSAPALAMYADNGRRIALCGFCRHHWQLKRVHCPFCQNEDNNSLQYLYSEEEPEYRVDVCDRCRKYLKCVDLRQTGRVFFAPLEHAATVHLDLKAREAGYTG